MNCPSCGAVVSGPDRFCGHCGSFLPEGAAPAAPSPPAGDDLGSVPPQPAQQAPAPHLQISTKDHEQPAAAEPSQPRAGVRLPVLVGLLAVLFLLAAAGGYLLLSVSNLDQTATSVASTTPESEPPSMPQEDTSAVGQAIPPSANPDLTPAPVTGLSPATDAGEPPPATRASQQPRSSAPVPEPKAAPSPPPAPVETPPAAAPPAAVRSNSGTGASFKQAAPKTVAASEPLAEAQKAPTRPVPVEPAVAQGVAAQSKAEIQAPAEAANEPAAPTPRRAPPGTRVMKPGEGPPPSPKLQPRPAAPPPQVRDEGVIFWTGRLRRNQTIVVDSKQASAGTLDGDLLPGTPVDVWVPSPAVALVERPNPQNNWGRVVFRCLRDTDRNVTLNIQWKRLQ